LLWAVGLGLIVSPLLHYIFFVQWIEPRAAHPLAFLAAIPPLKLGALFMAIPVGASVLSVRPIGWYAVVGYAAVTLGLNMALFFGPKGRPLTLLFAATGVACVAYFVRKEIRAPYFNPRLRWWVQSRLERTFDVEIGGRGSVRAKTSDVSTSGLFLATEGTFTVGEVLPLKIRIGAKVVEVSSVVARIADGSNGPKGIGVKFQKTGRDVERLTAELRERVRIRRTLRVDIKGKETIACKTFDVSDKGVFLTTDQPFKPGEKLAMTVHVGESPADVSGEVVWVSDGSRHPKGVGIKFESAGPAASQVMRQLLEDSTKASARVPFEDATNWAARAPKIDKEPAAAPKAAPDDAAAAAGKKNA
jgi:Tfp pilus assembly protein PilZ